MGLFFRRGGNGDNGHAASPIKPGTILEKYDGGDPNEALRIYQRLQRDHGEAHVKWETSPDAVAEFRYQ